MSAASLLLLSNFVLDLGEIVVIVTSVGSVGELLVLLGLGPEVVGDTGPDKCTDDGQGDNSLSTLLDGFLGEPGLLTPLLLESGVLLEGSLLRGGKLGIDLVSVDEGSEAKNDEEALNSGLHDVDHEALAQALSASLVVVDEPPSKEEAEATDNDEVKANKHLDPDGDRPAEHNEALDQSKQIAEDHETSEEPHTHNDGHEEAAFVVLDVELFFTHLIIIITFHLV